MRYATCLPHCKKLYKVLDHILAINNMLESCQPYLLGSLIAKNIAKINFKDAYHNDHAMVSSYSACREFHNVLWIVD